MGKAILAFADGTVFSGSAFGAKATKIGKAAFNSAVMGYQELVSDPASAGQIMVLTAVEVGNYGVNKADAESGKVWIEGLVLMRNSSIVSNWRSEGSLGDYLAENGVPGIEGLDTRAIAMKIVRDGAMGACLTTEDISEEKAVELAKSWSGLKGKNYAAAASCKNAFKFDDSNIEPFSVDGTDIYKTSRKTPLKKCAVIDLGAAKSVLEHLAYNGFDLQVFPMGASAAEIEKFAPECVFVSSGAGDPADLGGVVETIKALQKKYAVLGMGLGHVAIALANGAKARELKFGRKNSQPVKDVAADLVRVSAHNADFVVDEKSVEGTGLEITHVNLDDKSVEGLKGNGTMSVLFYPEATKGPQNTDSVYEAFYKFVGAK